MRPRVLAVCILILFLAIPVVLYWYFYEKKITSLIFQSENTQPYTVSLRGSLEYRYFPLLDQIFSYESTCIGSCIFSPIPPLKYTVNISGSGKEPLIDTVKISSGDAYKYKVVLIPMLDIINVDRFSSIDIAQRSNEFLGVDQEGVSVFLRMDRISQKPGIYLSGMLSPFAEGTLPIISGKIDISRSYAILQGSADEQYIFSLTDKRDNVVFPYGDDIDIVTYSNVWKIGTKNALYERIGDVWVENPRFTDYIDISPRYRIGYIDVTDQKKLSLQNLALDNSFFLLLDRQTAKISVIKKGYSIRGFLSYKGKPSVIDTTGSISNIYFNTDK